VATASLSTIIIGVLSTLEGRFEERAHGTIISLKGDLMPRAIRIHAFGDSSVMRYEEIPTPTPKPGEAVVSIEAVGVNYIDVYHRSGVYPMPLPITLGQEGAGTVTAVGEGVTSVKVGDRVAWTGIFGSYADVNVVPATRLVQVPAGLQTKQAAAIMLQGMTAHYLSTSTYPLKPGDTALVHAGAGGVGLLLTQIAKMRGARVITTVSTQEKAEPEVKRITNARGVQVVYDSVGQATFDKSLNSLAPRGMLVLFGQSSGKVDKIYPTILQKGSYYLTRPTIVHYAAERKEIEDRSRDLFTWVQEGKLRLRTEFEFPLEDAIAAHDALEGRKTTGKILLIP
jgi:NADPH:quinone reductase